MTVFYIAWLVISILLSAFISYKSLEYFNSSFSVFLIANFLLALCGTFLSIFIYGSYYPLFFISVYFVDIFVVIFGMALKSIFWHTRVICEEEDAARLEAIKNNPYYQQAHEEINNIMNGEEKPNKINLKK